MKYKVGDKVVVEIEKVFSNNTGSGYCVVLGHMYSEISICGKNEPLSAYTEPLEAKIRRQAAEITRLLEENKRLKAENEKMLVKIDAYELYGDQHEEEYNQAFNQGADKAWELARKIVNMPLRAKRDIWGGETCLPTSDEIFTDTYLEAAAKVSQWEKAKEEIKVGDVLEDVASSNVKCVVTNICSNNMAYLVFDDGSAGMNELKDMKKTGRHIDIDGFLKQIGEE